MKLENARQHVCNKELQWATREPVQSAIGEIFGLVPRGCCQALETGKESIERWGSVRLPMIRSEFGRLSNWRSFIKRKGHGDLLTRPTSYQSLVKQRQNGVCTFGNCLKPLNTLPGDFIRSQLREAAPLHVASKQIVP